MSTNLMHVDNLNSLAKLKTAGFRGLDVSVGESLLRGPVYKCDEDGRHIFVHHTSHSDDLFDRSSYHNETVVEKEWDWAFREDGFLGLLAYLGIDQEIWNQMPFPEKVLGLVSYYGTEEIFGTTYWEGFKIEGFEYYQS